MASDAFFPFPDCVEIALDVDNYTFGTFGNNCNAAVDWAVGVLAGVDLIYRNELNDLITLDARFLHIWGSPDPYIGVVNDGGGILGAFNSEWNNNPNFNSIPLDLKHFFTIRTNIGTGGIAYLSGLCNSFNAGVSGNLTTATTYNLDTLTPHTGDRALPSAARYRSRTTTRAVHAPPCVLRALMRPGSVLIHRSA